MLECVYLAGRNCGNSNRLFLLLYLSNEGKTIFYYSNKKGVEIHMNFFKISKVSTLGIESFIEQYLIIMWEVNLKWKRINSRETKMANKKWNEKQSNFPPYLPHCSKSTGVKCRRVSDEGVSEMMRKECVIV